ncbi:MAG TPA: CRISPR-associated endonuclease Cas1 [Thermoplasmata archaeon]|nr:CRISPR-associated endonuclease Cas1 [Thermoplasmata archaeon]
MIEKKLRNVVISGYGYKIKSKRGLILIKGEEDKIYLSPREVEQIIVAGEVSITSNVVKLLLTNGVDLVFVQHNPKFFARVMRNDCNFITNLWRKQIVMTEERKLEISKEIVDCLIYNKIRMLQHLEKNRNIDFCEEIRYLQNKREYLKECDSKISLMGIEGDATKVYFSGIRKIIPEEFGFSKRVKHPPLDPINSMLSYGYTILFSRVSYGLMLAGLNVFEGIFHESYRDRMALAYDLMEEFRQAIVDRVVITEVVRGRVSKDDFDIKPETCYMKDGFKKSYLDALYTRFEDKYNYYGKSMEFLDIIFEQAKKLADAIEKNINYKGFKYR